MWDWKRVVTILALIIFTGCTNQSNSAVVSEPAGGDDTAQLTIPDVLTALQQRTITPTLVGESLNHQWVGSAPGLAYKLGPALDRERLYIHVYPSAAAALERAAAIPPSADTGLTDWIDVPHFFRCNNLIALYLGQDPQVTDALTNLCGPQFAGQT